MNWTCVPFAELTVQQLHDVLRLRSEVFVVEQHCVFLEIDEHGYVDCGYCDRRFVLRGGPADGADQSQLPDISSGASL